MLKYVQLSYGLAVIVWRGLVRRDQSGYGGCGAVSGSWHD